MHNAAVLASMGCKGRGLTTYPAKFHELSSFDLCFVHTIHVCATSAPLVLNGMFKTEGCGVLLEMQTQTWQVPDHMS